MVQIIMGAGFVDGSKFLNLGPVLFFLRIWSVLKVWHHKRRDGDFFDPYGPYKSSRKTFDYLSTAEMLNPN